jgi:hypothetical protein
MCWPRVGRHGYKERLLARSFAIFFGIGRGVLGGTDFNENFRINRGGRENSDVIFALVSVRKKEGERPIRVRRERPMHARNYFACGERN